MMSTRALKPLPERTEAEAAATLKTGTGPEVAVGACHNGCHKMSGLTCPNTAERGDTEEVETVSLSQVQNARTRSNRGDSDRLGRDVTGRGRQKELVGRGGIEPPTPGFSVLCSTG